MQKSLPNCIVWLHYISVNLPIHDYLRKVFEAEEQMMILNEELANLKRKLELSDSQVRWLHMCNKWHYHWKNKGQKVRIDRIGDKATADTINLQGYYWKN